MTVDELPAALIQDFYRNKVWTEAERESVRDAQALAEHYLREGVRFRCLFTLNYPCLRVVPDADEPAIRA